MSNTVALLGANGQLGTALIRSWHEPDLELVPLSRQMLDISDSAAVNEHLSACGPRVIINCAAYTAVDAAEDEKSEAYAVNQRGTENIARWAHANRARVIHVSTDFVFNGESSRPYKPEDNPAPLGVYGASKLDGETALWKHKPEGAAVVRTGWLYSHHGNNFFTTMLKLLGERDYLNVVADQVGTPTSTAGLAILLRQMAARGAAGIYHFSDAGVASWYDFAMAIQEEALALGLLDREVPINPISSDQYPAKAKRPAYSVLDKARVYRDFSVAVVHWRVQLRAVLLSLKNGD
ncbi:MAG: dTDP-4-dehydrorhamnose reductase [Pseudohongiellaceae bacterium]